MSFNSGPPPNQQNQQPMFGSFGQPQQPAFGDTSKPAFGTFGSAPQPFGQTNLGATGTSAAQTPFGSAPAPTAFNAFGQQQQQQQPASAFGQPSSLFGQQPSAPFGQPSATATSAFGPSSSSFSFGQQPPQQLPPQPPQQQVQPSFTFGQQPAKSAPAPTLFGGQPSTGGFGQTPATTTPAFGQTASTTTPAFGQTASTTTPAFGQTASTTTPAFGQSFTGTNFFRPPQQAAPTTLAPTTATAPAPTAGLFGSSASIPTATNASRAAFEQPANPTPSTAGFPSFSAPTSQPAFSFGETKSGTTTAASAASQPAPIAQQSLLGSTPATQPKPGEPPKPAFTFGAASQQPSASLTAAPPAMPPPTQPPSSPAPAKEPPTKSTSFATFPSALKGKSLEEIVVGWQEELEDQVNAFQRVAIELATWDKEILANEEAVLGLADRVGQVETWEAELEQNLAFISAQQAELEGLLDLIEKELPAVADAMAPNVMPGGTMSRLSPADAERDRLFELASSLQGQLNDLSLNLSEMINDSNSLSAQTTKDDDAQTKQVLRIMNEQVQTLTWVDRQLDDLKRTKAYTRQLADKAKQHHRRLLFR